VDNGQEALIRGCVIQSRNLDVSIGLESHVVIESSELQGSVDHVLSAGDLTMRQCVVRGGVFALRAMGHLILEDCDFYDLLKDWDDPNAEGIDLTNVSCQIRRCRIYNVHGVALALHKFVQPGNDENEHRVGPRCVIEDCEFFETAGAALFVEGRHNAVIRRCTVRNAMQAGVLIGNNGYAEVEDCTIHNNTRAGIEIAHNSAPIIRRCMITASEGAGILVYKGGPSIIEDCDIRRNASAGVEIVQQGDIIARRCYINHNVGSAIYTGETGTCVVFNCDLTSNQEGAWTIVEGGRVRRDNNAED